MVEAADFEGRGVLPGGGVETRLGRRVDGCAGGGVSKGWGERWSWEGGRGEEEIGKQTGKVSRGDCAVDL